MLKLSLTSRANLWAEVVMPQGDRVFVPTNEDLAVGAQVGLSIETPEVPHVTCVVVVQGIRPAAGALPRGAWVRVDEPTVARLQQYVGHSTREEPQRVAGRTEPRVTCDFRARITSAAALPPGVSRAARDACTVKTISPHGLTLAGTIATEPGKVLTLVVTLPDGEAYLSGTVMWVRESVNQCGLRLISLDSVTESRLERVVNELSATPNEPVPQTGYTVLIADDDSSILDFLARLAIKAGHRVVRAERGDRALELVRQETPQLVFLDILMPGLDGLEVARAIRNDAALSGIPVVLLSAMGEARLSEAARNAGAADFLTKPVRVESVRSILTKYLPAAGKPALR